MLADYAERLNLTFTPPDAETAEKLRGQLPATATVSNPLDYTTPIWGIAEKTRPVFATLLGDGHDAAVIVQDYPAAGLDESKIYYRNDTRSFIEAAKEAKLAAAVCSTIPENLDAETRQFLVDHGVAPMQGIEECMTAIAQAAWHGRRRNEIAAEHRMPLLPPMPLSAAVALRDEAHGKSLLAAQGISVPAGSLTTGADAAANDAVVGVGALAIDAVRQTGCRVTGITLSDDQLRIARDGEVGFAQEGRRGAPGRRRGLSRDLHGRGDRRAPRHPTGHVPGPAPPPRVPSALPRPARRFPRELDRVRRGLRPRDPPRRRSRPGDRKSTRLNSSHMSESRMPSSA